jgi:ATP-dependent Clp protease ATP-binding subunit ClpA
MEDLSIRARQVLELMKKYSTNNNVRTIGSEFLILAMYETEDSLCHFLLSEYDITKEEIIDKTNNIYILRKEMGEYNSSLSTILKQARILANDNPISEEHLFMSVLLCRNTIACSILEALDLDIDDLVEDVKEIYDFTNYDGNSEVGFIRNITKEAKNQELDNFIDRRDYLKRLDVIINRKYKNNPLLIGNAGVGKTAIVEGYAKRLVESNSDYSVLALNLTSMLAGTRYRGDFEERFDKFIKEIASKKNVIVFIDEIHTIVGTATTDGNLDVANMLKPLLARNGIKLIGATTLEEYHRTIEKDKALSRRFQTIYINEPNITETFDIMFGIKEDYEEYHNVRIDDKVLEYLINQSDKYINNKYRPDKCIDILDDLLSTARINNKDEVTIEDVDNSINCYLGNRINKEIKDLNYKELEKYHWLYNNHLLEEKPLLKIRYEGNEYGLEYLLSDLKHIFNIGEEAILLVDLEGYKDNYMLSSLVGAPPGYVGYNEEGLLSKHVLNYPNGIMVFKNFKSAGNSIRSFINNLLINGFFNDQKSRLINLNNIIVVIEGIENNNYIGFNKDIKEDNCFDEYIRNDINLERSFNELYEKALSRMNYEISFDFNINKENKKEVNDYLYRFVRNNKNGKYKIKKEDLSI